MALIERKETIALLRVFFVRREWLHLVSLALVILGCFGGLSCIFIGPSPRLCLVPHLISVFHSIPSPPLPSPIRSLTFLVLILIILGHHAASRLHLSTPVALWHWTLAKTSHSTFFHLHLLFCFAVLLHYSSLLLFTSTSYENARLMILSLQFIVDYIFHHILLTLFPFFVIVIVIFFLFCHSVDGRNGLFLLPLIHEHSLAPAFVFITLSELVLFSLL